MSTQQISEQAVAAREQGRQPDGRFGPTAAPESGVTELAPAPARMSHEDHRFLATEAGTFAEGYTEEDVDRVLGDLEGAEMVVVWNEHSDGMFTGDSEIVGRVGDGPWRPVSPQMWDHLTGQDGSLGGGTCTECGGECVVEEDGVSHHLTADGDVDHDADADHVALDESLVENPGDGPAPVLSEATPLLADEPYERQDLDGMYRSGANVAVEVDHDELDDDVCGECGASLDDGEGADGLCGSCADVDDRAVMRQARETGLAAGRAWQQAPDSPRTQVDLLKAADDFVDTAVDRGGDYDDVDEAAIGFRADPSSREKGDALVAALEAYDVGDDDEDDYDPDLAYQQMVGAGYSPKVADEVAGTASSYESAYEMAILAEGR